LPGPFAIWQRLELCHLGLYEPYENHQQTTLPTPPPAALEMIEPKFRALVAAAALPMPSDNSIRRIFPPDSGSDRIPNDVADRTEAELFHH